MEHVVTCRGVVFSLFRWYLQEQGNLVEGLVTSHRSEEMEDLNAKHARRRGHDRKPIYPPVHFYAFFCV